MTNPNDCAYPADSKVQTDGGLTKREYFAAMALQSFIEAASVRNETLLSKVKRLFGFYTGEVRFGYNHEANVKSSIEVADIMIEELNK